MSNPDEQRTSFIPPNFIEKGKILNGTFDIRNAIEAIIFALLIGVPVIHLPFSLTTRIIILCMTALPAAMVSLIGIGGESITAFLMNALRFLKNRRVIYRSDAMPEPKKKRQKLPGTKEAKKPAKRERRKKKAKKGSLEDSPPFEGAGQQDDAPPTKEAPQQDLSGSPSPTPSGKTKRKKKREPKVREHKSFDTSTRRGIRRQAREDIRQLAYEQKCAKIAKRREERAEKEKLRAKKKQAAQDARLAARQTKAARKAEDRKARETQDDKAVQKSASKSRQTASQSSARKKKRKFQTIEDYLPIEKIAHGVIYTTDGRYVKILEVEPINFLLRSAREQMGIIYSFISYLKISPVKLQIKMISKRADINQHLEKSRQELENETDPRCRELQEDYLKFVRNLSSREAVSRRFFLVMEYEPFNANRKVTEREILESLETTAQTAKTFLYQCGNEVTEHENPDEFTTDVLYTLLNRSLCATHPLQERIASVLARYAKENRADEDIRISEFLSPETLDFRHSSYVLINGVYHSYLYVPSSGYKSRVVPGWLSLLVNAGEGIDVDFYLHRQPKDKIQQRLGQQIRINRSKIKDASDTNTDYDDLDSAIRSGYFLKQGLANNEDFYYMSLLITVTASTLEELQWRVQEMKKLLISQDMDLRTCYFLQEQGFLSTLPLASLDKKLYQLSRRNVLTSGAASCYPFVSYSICDDNGILFGVNKHNNSLVIADIFDSRQYKNATWRSWAAPVQGKPLPCSFLPPGCGARTSKSSS